MTSRSIEQVAGHVSIVTADPRCYPLIEVDAERVREMVAECHELVASSAAEWTAAANQ